MTSATKNITSDGLLNFCAIYEAQSAGDARTLGMWFDDKLREAHNEKWKGKVWSANNISDNTVPVLFLQVLI